MNNKLYFTAFAEGLGGELWETDGTPAGTKLFKEILPGPDGGIPFLMPNFRITPGVPWLSHEGNQFYFMFGQPVDGVELWKSDGTEAGTVKVKTIKTDGNDFGNLSYVYTTAGLYFSVDDGEDGDELWKSDGTEAGTVKVLDLNPGPEGSEISFFPIAVSGRVLFTATNGDDEFMHDLYRLDGAMIPLPVRLETFNATLAGADGKLQWTTSVEQGTDAFVIERSSDGQQFSRIGSVSAAGNSASRRHYTFTDLGVTHNGLPVVYYRLRMIDKDGKEAYSSVVKLQIKSGTPFSVQLLGNPVQQEIRLSLPQTSAPIQITIRDAAGRTVKAAQVKNENNIFTMPATGLAPGNYFLTVESNGQAGVVKFIKQ
jgi:ELWxxDGT repeat protein